MSENLDNLLVEAFAKNLFKDNDNTAEDAEDGEIDKEEGEIESADEDKSTTDHKKTKTKSDKHKHKKSKLKSKHKTKAETHSKSLSKKLIKRSSKICSKVDSKAISKSKLKSETKNSSNGKKSPKKESSKHKKSKSSEKSDKTKHKKSDENESEVMKLLLSKQLKSYADIQFKDEEMSPEKEPKKSKHKSSKKDEKRDKHKDKDKKSKHKKSEDYKYNDDYYEKQKYSYYSTHSSTEHEDFFYGSYYEGPSSMPRRGSRSREYSRPPSPLWDYDSRRRSRSRSPIGRDKRSISPTSRYYTYHRSHSPENDYRKRDNSYRRNSYRDRRSLSPGGRSRRSISVSSTRSIDRIDKKKLYEIARINLVKMIEKGDLPKGTDINKLKLHHLRELTTQKSVQQWTEFCRAISELESAVADDSDLDMDYDSDDDNRSVASEIVPIRHPFKVNERKDIQMRIRGFPQLPSRSAKELAIELREQFPVSSGNQHRRKELEWTEVEAMPPPALPAPKPKAKKIETKLTEILNPPQSIPEETLAYKIILPTTASTTTTSTITTTTSTTETAITAPLTTTITPVPSVTTDAITSPTIGPTISPSIVATGVPPVTASVSTSAEITAEPKPPEPQPEAKSKDSVFPQSTMSIDIGTVMAQRLNAMRKLQEDPHNVVALKQMYQANQMVDIITHPLIWQSLRRSQSDMSTEMDPILITIKKITIHKWIHIFDKSVCECLHLQNDFSN